MDPGAPWNLRVFATVRLPSLKSSVEILDCWKTGWFLPGIEPSTVEILILGDIFQRDFGRILQSFQSFFRHPQPPQLSESWSARSKQELSEEHCQYLSYQMLRLPGWQNGEKSHGVQKMGTWWFLLKHEKTEASVGYFGLEMIVSFSSWDVFSRLGSCWRCCGRWLPGSLRRLRSENRNPSWCGMRKSTNVKGKYPLVI